MPTCKISFRFLEKSENIIKVGKYGKIREKDLKNLKHRSDVSNEILD